MSPVSEVDVKGIILIIQQLVLFVVITNIENVSLLSGVFPTLFKYVLMKPLLQKSTLDVNVLNNYRPASNLIFLSKIIKTVVFTQLWAYLRDYTPSTGFLDVL